MTLLPVEPAWRLKERTEEHRWLVAGLWAEQAVGIVGGEPKCCKSFLALDIAVAVATATSACASPHSPPPAASSRPTPDTALPAVDRGNPDYLDAIDARASTSQFRFPSALQPAATGTGKFNPYEHRLPYSQGHQ